jgi:hypothetical protein
LGVNGHRPAGLFINSRWFALADLGLVALCGAIWYLRPEAGWLPVFIAFIPWLIRSIAGASPFVPTRFDIPILLFLGTAFVGTWAAYEPVAAWNKFWLIVGAVLIFYAVAGQPQENLWLLAGSAGFVGVAVAAYFLLTHDWEVNPAKVDFLNRLGLRWMAIRPGLDTHQLHANVAGGMMAMFAPFLVGFGLFNWKNRRFPMVIAVVLGGLLLLVGFLLATSRGAWLALAAALGFWFLWSVTAYLAPAVRQRREYLFGGILLVLSLVGMLYILSYPGGPISLANRLPGPANAGSRVEIFTNTVDLIGDYLITGAGLDAFRGLYSQYLLILPSFVLPHSHNLTLDILLEQGLFGLLAFGLIIAGAFWYLSRSSEKRAKGRRRYSSLLRWSVATSLLVVLIHGLIDDALYGSGGALFLFFLPGLAVAIFHSNQATTSKIVGEGERQPFFNRRLLTGMGVAAVVIVLLLVGFQRSLLAAWYADLGAIEMAKSELVDWPTDQWDDGSRVSALASSESLFNQALENNPRNQTAHYRLGLIAMLQRDYEAAVAHLEAAYLIDPDHRGIRKSLGYSYLWGGNLEAAQEILKSIAEAPQEMGNYGWWWATQQRPDLAERATLMGERLLATQSQGKNQNE